MLRVRMDSGWMSSERVRPREMHCVGLLPWKGETMKIMIACECSGIVREAFRKLGHDAWSCDTQPADDNSKFHYQQDVLPLLKEKWDMIIAFPPCTDLAVSGARYFEAKRKDGRQQKAIEFFMKFVNADCERIAIENPVGTMSTVYRKPDQIIQPWQFGEDASKKTCLWLKGLPLLVPTKIIVKDRYENQTASGQNRLAPSPDRAKIRSKTYQGIADAMAKRWSSI